jgi:hypothetical protein
MQWTVTRIPNDPNEPGDRFFWSKISPKYLKLIEN